MPYGGHVVKKRSSAVLALAFVIVTSCGGAATPTGTTATGATATNAAVATGGAASGAPTSGGPSFGQILGSAKATEYKVTYSLNATGGGAFSGEQSWFFKPPKARFDFSTSVGGQTAVVSLYALPDGTYMCFGGSGQGATCIGMSGLDTALQQNPAALFQESMIQHPENFNGVLVETRQIAGQQAHCYDVKPVNTVTTGLTDGRYCYSAQGIPLLQRFGVQGGTWSMEATKLSSTVPDSDFTLPAKPTTIGVP
jgi:hypothetical protein